MSRGKGELTTPINILVSRASATAIEAVEALGGKVVTRYYTRPSIARLLKGESESASTPLGSLSEGEDSPILAATSETAAPFTFRLPDPTSRKDMEYYRDAAHRGYLSHLVKEGHGPSLFFKTPGMGVVRKKAKKANAAGENKVW